MFDSDGVCRVLLVSPFGISCGEVCEEACGPQSSGCTDDSDSEGGLEQLRLLSSDIYVSSPQDTVKKV